MSCGVGHRCGLDMVFLWLWCSLAATDPIQPLAWETPYAAGEAPVPQKSKKKKKKKIAPLGQDHISEWFIFFSH